MRLQYASAHRPIFDGLSFSVAPRTRVGVVGRTGAGKSSLTVALFRVVELATLTLTLTLPLTLTLTVRALRRRQHARELL